MSGGDTSIKRRLRVTLVKSLNGRLKKHKACARGLGLRYMHHTVELDDTDCIRGMISKISYLLKMEEI